MQQRTFNPRLALLVALLGCCAFISFLYTRTKIFYEPSHTKIVGLIAARNEAPFIKNCIKALALYSDAIVFLDDVSTDETLAIAKSLEHECHIEKFIEKKIWARDEKGDKNALLAAGREIGGTHFIMVDSDEMFVASCARDQWLKNLIRSLKPGQVLQFPLIHIYGDHLTYRDDALVSPYGYYYASLCSIFGDDGSCTYDDNSTSVSKTIHVPRIPFNMSCQGLLKNKRIYDLDHGMLHFTFVNLDEILNKKIWYMCLEFIKKNEITPDPAEFPQNAKIINKRYQALYAPAALDHQELVIRKQVPACWYEDYDFFDPSCYYKQLSNRKEDIIAWVKKHGSHYFKDLDIWQTEWLKAIS